MNTWSIILFLLGLLYLIIYFVEIPFFYEGNPKTRLIINKLGKKGYKLILLVMGVVFIVLAFVFK